MEHRGEGTLLQATFRYIALAMRAVHPGLIYDVGLHDAADTAYFLRNGYRVVAVDANPAVVKAAATRFGREVAEGRFIPLNVGIAEGEGTKTFWVSDARTEWSSFDTAIAGRLGPPRGVEVSLRSFESILAEHGVPLYCKIDIEGNDDLCLAGMRPDFRPTFVSVEITPRELQPRPLLEALSGLGYDRFKVVHQLSFTVPHRGWYVARQAGVVRLGKSVLEQLNGLLRGHRWEGGWRFRIGSSGPLPQRLPGRWMTAEATARLEAQLEDLFRRGVLGDPPDWFDLHATDQATLQTIGARWR